MLRLAELSGKNHVPTRDERMAGAKQAELLVIRVTAVAVEEGFL